MVLRIGDPCWWKMDICPPRLDINTFREFGFRRSDRLINDQHNETLNQIYRKERQISSGLQPKVHTNKKKRNPHYTTQWFPSSLKGKRRNVIHTSLFKSRINSNKNWFREKAIRLNSAIKRIHSASNEIADTCIPHCIKMPNSNETT